MPTAYGPSSTSRRRTVTPGTPFSTMGRPPRNPGTHRVHRSSAPTPSGTPSLPYVSTFSPPPARRNPQMPASQLLVPALDPAPIPGPAWLFHVLLVATFLLHLLFVNAVLGGTLLAATASFAGKRLRPLAVLFVEMNSWTISLAITFGVAPLLFLQVLYGRFFYSATILVARGWLGMIVLLTMAYYLNYVVKGRLRKGGDAPLLLAVEALLFLAIAAIQVAVYLLQVQPALWDAASRNGFAILSDPSFAPRFLHFVL